jgi:hypothetical protein
MLPVVAQQLKEDNLHVRTWNQFAQDILSFHKQRIKQMDIRIKKRAGGYSHLPEFYIEESFYDDGRLVATITWEKENPEQLHTIEVFVHDDKGRVIRDYAAAYLPHYHNAPNQTLISLHNYSNGLHAFRSFDASGYRIIERCTGTYKGKDVNFILDEDEIAEALNDTHQNTGIMVTDKYKNCFGDLPQDVGEYTNPQ